MGSADWMPRNLDKRVEILFPVEDPDLKKEIVHILHTQLADNTKAHLLQPDGLIDPEKDGLVKVYGGCYKKQTAAVMQPSAHKCSFVKKQKRMQNNRIYNAKQRKTITGLPLFDIVLPAAASCGPHVPSDRHTALTAYASPA